MSATTIFSATHNGHTCEVLMITASKTEAPKYQVVLDGVLDLSIGATKAWRTEQKTAVAHARSLLGLPEPTSAPAPTIMTNYTVSGVRLARMAALYAENLRASGATALAEELLRLGREHAETWAALGRTAFTNEIARLEAEANDLCEAWDDAARNKVTLY